jgi:hypothetical protein
MLDVKKRNSLSELEEFLPESVGALTENYFPRGAPLPPPGCYISYF